MVENALALIDGGYIDEAIVQLEDAYKKCDGDPHPKDLGQWIIRCRPSKYDSNDLIKSIRLVILFS